MAVSFSFVGKIVPVKDSEKFVGYEEKDYQSGWMTQKLRWNLICGDNRHLVEINAGRWKDEKKNSVIYTYSKAAPGKKSEPITIPYDRRNDPDVINGVAGYRVFTVDLDTRQNREALKKNEQMEELAKSESKRKHFIAGSDFVDYARKVVYSDKIKDMLFRVNGNVVYSYSESTKKYYKKYEVTKIYKVDPSVEPTSDLNVEFFYTEGFMNKEAIDETGKVLMSGYTTFYDNNTKKNWFAPIEVVVRNTKENIDILEECMGDFGEGDVNKVLLSCQDIDGAQRRAVTIDDLSPSVQKAIRAGLMDEKEQLRKAGGEAYGDEIKEFRYVKMSEACETTAYTLDDVNAKPHKEAEEEVVNLFEDDDNDDLEI